MQWQLSPSVIAEAATALGLLVVAIYFPWRDLNRRARLTGSILLIVAALWVLTHSLEIGTPVASRKAYLMGLQLIWGLFAMTLWLLYIIHYIAPERWQTGRILTLFGIAPLLTILAVATNHIHGLMWTAPGLDLQNPYLPLRPDYGPVYWVCMAYMGGLTAYGGFLILKKVVRQNNFRMWEPWTLILAVAIPLVAAFLEVAGFTQPAGLTVGITPFFSGFGVIALVWSLPRFHLQKVIPVARHVIFQRISDGVVVLNMQNRVVDLNPAAEHLAGYASSEALGLPVEQIWTNWPSEVEPSEPGSTVHGGLVLACAGEQRTYDLHFYTINDEKDRPLNKVVLLIDTTERKRAEDALTHSHDLMRYVIEHNRSAIAVHDRDLKYVYVSQRYLQDYRVKDLDVIGKHLYDVFPNLPQKLRDVYQKVLAGETSSAEDDPYVQEDGAVDWTRWECRPWYGADGSIGGIIIYTEVITEHKRAEEEKSRLEGQLLQAQKMETVGQLAGGVAHDFNNMLQVIISYVEMSLGKVEAGQPVHKYLLEIRRAAQRSAEITGQLLAFARKQTVSPKVLDLNDAVAGTQKMIQRLIGEDIDLARMPGHDLWKVKIDPAQLDQILANLAVNARDAIGGVGKLTIETENVTFDEAYCATHAGYAPGEYLLLAVSDDGCGMNKQTMSHLFEPFFTTKGPGKGTGLGLATIYGIVKQNNGFINVYSEPGHGTTFKVYLPRAGGAAEIGQVEAEVAAPRGGTETVLVAEDETAILELARESLEQLGYTVLTARTPEDAIRSNKEHPGPIHLLITDVVMPQMNGRQLAERLVAARAGLKCLYMSGYTANVIAHRGVLEEGVSFIAKPFSLTTLAAKVREVLDSESGKAT
jgi:two-component system cell cycle sensor histidine kinase/response regulator CckA